MTRITPFEAIIYNQEKIKDLSSVVCPPYDVISPEKQEGYHQRSPYNLIHILLGKDTPGEDKYRRAGTYFKNWLDDGIFIRDETQAVYFYEQQYSLKGEKKTRMGFIALLYLQEENSSIFRHEHTRLEPKEDRLRLLREVRANLSPIFVTFSDKKRIIHGVYQQYLKDKPPFIDIVDEDKIAHRLWRVDSPEVLDKIQLKMTDADIFIADGHHRYEVACAFRDEMKQKMGGIPEGHSFNYILAYFTNADSRDLTILPIHRLVHLGPQNNTDNIYSSLKEFFDVEEVKEKVRFFFLMEKGGRTEHVLGMYKDRRFWLLRLKNVKLPDRVMGEKPAEFRSLDVSILNYIIFKKIMGMDLEDKTSITFSPHPGELIEAVDKDPSCIAFFLNPVRMQQIISVALSGNRMPAKSTYFYPKLASGLVINKLNGDY